MIERHKSEKPGATGFFADQTKTDNAAILNAPGSAVNATGHAFDLVEFRQLRSRFARRGYRLQRVYRAGDGRPTYQASRGFGTRVLSHPHDVLALLSVVEGVPT